MKPYLLLAGVLFSASLTCFSTGGQAADEDAAEIRIPFHAPALKAEKMPPVFFSHERHVQILEAADMDCTDCHVYTKDGFSQQFKDSAKIPAADQVAYVHKGCVQCHERMEAGPRMASCRSCHDPVNAAAHAGGKQ